MDKIKIENLEVFAKHGVFPEENKLGQKFLVSAVLYTDTRKAGMTDDLAASIHYGEVSLPERCRRGRKGCRHCPAIAHYIQPAAQSDRRTRER